MNFIDRGKWLMTLTSVFVVRINIFGIRSFIMEELPIKIGEHYIHVVCSSSKIFNIFKKNFQHFICPFTGVPDMNVTIEDGYGTPFVDYEVKRSEEANRISFQRADYLIQVDSNYKNTKVSVYDELALKHALMNLYSSFIVYHNWGLLIHSSCVLENGSAHIFSGHSGAGKSTAARLSHPRELLSDEATIVKITKASITVYNSPFRSERDANGDEQISRLESIQLLNQALSNKRIEIKKTEALFQLIDKVFYWSYKPEETTKVLNLLKLLVEQVPVYQLHFQKNNTFWELIS
jgi:hypothetical protein